MTHVERFAGVVTKYKHDLYRWFLRRVNHSEDAEELTANVFHDLWRKWSQYADHEPWPLLLQFARCSLLSWQRTTTRAKRRQEWHQRLLGGTTAETVLPEFLERWIGVAGPVKACIEHFSQRLQKVFELCYERDLTDREIAEYFSTVEQQTLSPDAVKQMRLRAVLAVKRCLESKHIELT